MGKRIEPIKPIAIPGSRAVTTMEYESPVLNGHEPDRDPKRAQRRMRELLEHIDLLDQERTATGMATRRLATRRHLVGLLLAALDEFHGIEAE